MNFLKNNENQERLSKKALNVVKKIKFDEQFKGLIFFRQSLNT